MKNIIPCFCTAVFLILFASNVLAQTSSQSPTAINASNILDGAWSEAQIDELLDRTLTLHLKSDIKNLHPNEKKAVEKLLIVGEIFNNLYEVSRHPYALQLRSALEKAAESEGANRAHAKKLLQLYYIMKGPITSTLDNQRTPFLATDAERPGKNVYPLDITKEELESYFENHPEQQEDILHLRSIVKRNNAVNRGSDLAVLDQYPSLDTLHPGFRTSLKQLKQQGEVKLYATPYSIAYADDIMQAFDLLNEAAGFLDDTDPAFAQFLRLRSRDILVDNYDGGDAAWVTSRFTGNLNAQIGSYETYDDSLYGVKSFFSLSLLQRDQVRSAELVQAIDGIQEIEDALPYDGNKRVREDIPVSVYNIIADFGQARGTNTATILPNESHLSRQYGRTILIRGSILTNPQIFAAGQAAFEAAIDPKQHNDLQPDGNLYRTLWHEIGHYLGVDRTSEGEELDTALQDTADLLEEMKADLVSLFAAPRLVESGLHTEQQLKSIYASGILRVLQKNKPRRSQAYQTMQLIQWNWFLDQGLLTFDDKAQNLHINYDAYPKAVSGLLKEVLALQSAGDRNKAENFIKQWTQWNPDLHGVIAEAMKAKEKYRFRMVTYDALNQL